MSHLSNALTRILRERPNLSASEVSRIVGVDRSMISKLINGTVSASPEVLTKLAGAIGRNKAERAALVTAHMKDYYGSLYDDFFKLITAGRYNPTSNNFHPDIEYLQKHLSDPGIRNAVRGIVELHQEKSSKKSSAAR